MLSSAPVSAGRRLRPATVAIRARAFCAVCGQRQVATDPNDPICTDYLRPTGLCLWCGSTAGDWAFLTTEPGSPDTIVTLRCPFRVPYPGRGGEAWDTAAWEAWHAEHGTERCEGTFAYPLRALRTTIHTGGNGPNTYLLACRLEVQGRCATCAQWAHASALVKANRDALLAGWRVKS